MLLAQATTPPPDGLGNWGQLAFLILAAFVMVVQLVNSIMTNRNNREVIKAADANHDNLVDLAKEKYIALDKAIKDRCLEIDKVVKDKAATLHDDLIVLTTNVNNIVKFMDKLEKIEDDIVKLDKIVDFRDEEGRRRIYTPNNYDAMQNKTLELLTGLVNSQKAIADELQKLNSKAENQSKNCEEHLRMAKEIRGSVKGEHSA